MAISPADRARFERQAAALDLEQTDDEGTPAQRWAYIEWANAERARLGLPELQTEGEVHWRARALGLLGRVSRPAGGAR